MEYTFDDAVLQAVIARLPGGRATLQDREAILVAMTNISAVPGWDIADEPDLTEGNYLAALLNELASQEGHLSDVAASERGTSYAKEVEAEAKAARRVLDAFRAAYPEVEPKDFG